MRLKLLGLILFLYSIPIFALTFYAKTAMTEQSRWMLFSSGWGLAIFGSTVLYWMLCRWEWNIKARYEKTEKVVDVQEKYIDVQKLLQENLEEFEKIKEENNRKEKIIEDLEKQFQLLQVNHESEREHKQKELDALHFAINEKSFLIKERENHIIHLEEKEKDLQYEIKTLLQLSTTFRK